MSTRWTRIETLVHDALARPAAERAAFLDTAGGSEVELRQEAASLLAQQIAARSFLETRGPDGASRPPVTRMDLVRNWTATLPGGRRAKDAVLQTR